ncbi:MAG: urease accessory protein UreE [Oscillospiraceae bacterium]|jgi:urease accessory protein|nr:urease accessory protein UreE [Oscillospiraceae bacterium]MDD3261020.1 urease accessory protein UreE [Oscillospiraceae bacterium]
MIYEQILGNLKDRPDLAKETIDFVPVEWFDTQKTIFRLRSVSGRDVCIRQENGHRLHDGDILSRGPQGILAVKVRPSEVLKLKLETPEQAARLGWELGNRHLPVVIDAGGVTVPYDEPTFSYLQQRGFSPKRCTDVFTGSLVHSHHHEHGG